MFVTPPTLRRSQRIMNQRNVNSNTNPIQEVHHQLSNRSIVPNSEKCIPSNNFTTASLPDRQMHQQYDDNATGNNRISCRSLQDHDVTSQNFNLNTQQNTTASHISSNLVTSDRNRRRLQIQIEFAKKKQDATLRVLEIQEKLALAELDENDENYIDNNDDSHSIVEVDCRRNFVNNWLHNSKNVANNLVDKDNDTYINYSDDLNINQPNHYHRVPETYNIHNPNIHVNQEQIDRTTSSLQQIQPKINQIENWITRQTISKELPKFTGNPLDWPQFITQYKTSSRLCNLSNTENQMRLQKSLSGQALSVVQPLLIYPNNVDRVIEILERRFGRTEYIIRLLMERGRNFSVN